MKLVCIITGLGCLVFFCGCDSGTAQSAWEQVHDLKREVTELKLYARGLEDQKQQLSDQVNTLSALGQAVEPSVLGELKKIVIAKRTGFFDKDEDGVKEKLIVYLRPIDEKNDAVKAPGSAHVQLWNLNLDEHNAMLSEWTVGAEELKVLWSQTMMTNYYRLTFDVAERLGNSQDELTVKVAFTDYIRGKTLKEQKVIKP